MTIHGRVSGDRLIVTCAHCAWSASHKAPSTPAEELEARVFLRCLLVAHCESDHPDKFTKGDP